MTAKQLQRLCRDWQRRLRLQDWVIEVRLEKPDSPTDYGYSDVDYHDRLAIVTIMPPAALPKSATANYRDLEQTLVHELLHIYFDALPGGELKDREQAINAIAQALVTAKRESQ